MATELQHEQLAEICGVLPSAEFVARVNVLNMTAVARLTTEITLYEAQKNKTFALAGGREGAVLDPDKKLLRIVNRVRTRLGYVALDNLAEWGKPEANSSNAHTSGAAPVWHRF